MVCGGGNELSEFKKYLKFKMPKLPKIGDFNLFYTNNE
jgi:hypothetical protein